MASERKIFTRSVTLKDTYSSLTLTLAEWDELGKQAVANVPAQFIETATIEISASGDYDGGLELCLAVEWREPESDEAYSARQMQEAMELARQRSFREHHERQLLASLMAKYNPAPKPVPAPKIDDEQSQKFRDEFAKAAAS